MSPPPPADAFPGEAAALSTAGVTFFERGWLSSNNILIQGGPGPTALVDSGYASHTAQTLALVGHALPSRPLDLLLNTHLHSDHCGGNAALQQAYPALQTLIPPGQAEAVANWDPVALTYEPTGQTCPPFRHDGVLEPGHTIQLGPQQWEIHAAKGHDPHSIVLFQPDSRLLISADALWENGFGIVFPELEGVSAFDEVANTLELIQRLNPSCVLPGHGRIFHDVDAALVQARSRLHQFVSNPDKHRRHAHKVLIKFKLLEWQAVSMEQLLDWVLATQYFAGTLPDAWRADRAEVRDWLDDLIRDLERSQALQRIGNQILNS